MANRLEAQVISFLTPSRLPLGHRKKRIEKFGVRGSKNYLALISKIMPYFSKKLSFFFFIKDHQTTSIDLRTY